MTSISELESKVRARRALPPPDMRRAIRKAAGLTHGDMAEPLGVSRHAIARWEAGTRTPRGPLLQQYGDLLQQLRDLA